MDGQTPLDEPPQLAALREDGPIALFLDFDGTLVDLADSPDAISVPSGLGKGLRRLADALEGRLALISGRAIIDVDRHLGDHGLARAGSHGMDRLTASGDPLGDPAVGLPEDVKLEIEEFSRSADFDLERKSHGSALHFRREPHRGEEAMTFAAELAGRHGLQVKHGKCIVEIVRPGADKGGAVRAFMATDLFAGARPVFVGDDITDEDGFVAAEALGGFGILVGQRPDTAARYGLAGIREVQSWLGI